MIKIFHGLFNERSKLNLKCLLTSFSINFDHKLIGERCVCVFAKVKVAELVDQRVEVLLVAFLDQFALLSMLPMRTRKEI